MAKKKKHHQQQHASPPGPAPDAGSLDDLEALQVLSLQGCEKLIEVPESLTRCHNLNTLTLWGCIVLVTMPDLTPLPKLQIDGVPEQLADWEAEQKRKRAADAAAGRNMGTTIKAPTGGGWKEAAAAVLGMGKKPPPVQQEESGGG